MKAITPTVFVRSSIIIWHKVCTNDFLNLACHIIIGSSSSNSSSSTKTTVVVVFQIYLVYSITSTQILNTLTV